MKKTMMTLAVVFCCAMSSIMFTACGGDDDDNISNENTQADVETPVLAVMSGNFELTDEMLAVLDVTAEYYDADGKVQTEKITQKKWSKSVTAKLPARLGIRLKAQLKDGVDANAISVFTSSLYCARSAYAVNAIGKKVTEGVSFSNRKSLSMKGEDIAGWLERDKNVLVGFLYDFTNNGEAVAGSWQ